MLFMQGAFYARCFFCLPLMFCGIVRSLCHACGKLCAMTASVRAAHAGRTLVVNSIKSLKILIKEHYNKCAFFQKV